MTISPVALMALVGGCGSPVPPITPSASPASNAAGTARAGRPLPTLTPVTQDPNAVLAYGGIGLQEAFLHSDPGDPAVVWLDVGPVSRRVALVWPPGYLASFHPDLEVADPSGTVALREGDQIEGACVTADPNVLLLEPLFEVAPPSPVVPTAPGTSPVSTRRPNLVDGGRGLLE